MTDFVFMLLFRFDILRKKFNIIDSLNGTEHTIRGEAVLEIDTPRTYSLLSDKIVVYISTVLHISFSKQSLNELKGECERLIFYLKRKKT
jgi:hypothetical protein